MDITVIIFLAFFAVLIGIWANNWGRSGLGWGFGALLFSPLLAALVLLVVGKTDAKKTEEFKRMWDARK